jgi:branched-chain amino acid transport system permease protein
VRAHWFWLAAAAVGLAVLLLTRLFFTNEYFFFAAYVVLEYVVLSTAWNILGGYTGYINFGTGAFFAIGVYSSVALHKLPALLHSEFDATMPPIPLPVMMLVGGIIAGIVGLGTGYLTLRLRGVFFAIATLALAVVVQTLIVNWDFVGGSRGINVIRPTQAPLGGGYIQYLYSLMLVLAVIAVGVARAVERSRLGLGFAAIRDDELAAEAGGVPTLRLKLIATTLSGALMGMAGAPLPYYQTYIDPASSFNLAYAVNSVAMPVIGGMTSWVGPVIGAVLLGTIQQLATVGFFLNLDIPPTFNLLIVGLLLIGFVIIAPNGMIGLPRQQPFLFSFRGRVSLGQYWLFLLLPLLAIGVALKVVEVILGRFYPQLPSGLLVGLFGLATIWPMLAVTVKRAHDRNRSGWILLLWLVPLFVAGYWMHQASEPGLLGTLPWIVTAVVAIWFFIDLQCLSGTIGANRFGPDPVESPVEPARQVA